MGRHRLSYDSLVNTGRDVRTPRHEPLPADRWDMAYVTEYTRMVGRRLKRIRDERGLTQGRVMYLVERPDGRNYSRGLLSRIESGYANSPLYVYLHLADFYELDPAAILGPEDDGEGMGEAEMALIEALRRLGISPGEAMARLARSEPDAGQRAA